MTKYIASLLVLFLLISGCSKQVVDSNDTNVESTTIDSNITMGSETYRGFIIDNIFHSQDDGDIHFNLYVPDTYDGNSAYALFITLPGYEGLYFQGVGVNIRQENFGFEALNYNDEMIVVAPQLNGWDEKSANETIALVEYLISSYNIDKSKVYIEGFSGGGETASIVVSKRPDLFTAYLQVSSKWDGQYQSVVDAHLPVYLAIGRDDEYYGSHPSIEAYNTLYDLYVKQGLTKEEIDEILVLDIKEREYFTSRNMTSEHGGGGLFALDEEIMSWLFNKSKEIN